MITIFSGDDIVSSRKAYLETVDSYKVKDYEVSKFAGKDLTAEILESFSNPISLFGEKKCLAIEGLLSLPKSKIKDEIIHLVSRGEVVVDWEGKEFSKMDQTKYPDFTFKNFKLPQILFRFLDSLTPGKIKENVTMFHEVVLKVDPAYIFLMVVRQIRLLILAMDGETEGLQTWQIGKLINQAKLFEKEKLKVIYGKLLEIDYKQKTSGSPFDIVGDLDILMVDI